MDDKINGCIEYISSLSLEDLEIKPSEFTAEQRTRCEEWCKPDNPYWCKQCHSQTMIDRGRRFQCQLCTTEYECEDLANLESWRKNVIKVIMGSVK